MGLVTIADTNGNSDTNIDTNSNTNNIGKSDTELI